MLRPMIWIVELISNADPSGPLQICLWNVGTESAEKGKGPYLL